jgi:hypothetical protein
MMNKFGISHGIPAAPCSGPVSTAGRSSPARVVTLLLLLLAATALIGCHRVRQVGDDAVIGFSMLVILAVAAVPMIAIAFGLFLCRDEENRPAGLCTVLAAAMLGILIVPCIALDTIRITDEKISHRSGLWFWPNRKEFRYEEIVYMEVGERVTWEDEVELEWRVHLTNGKSRNLEVGDLWESATGDLIYELRARGVDVRTSPF